MKPIYLFFCSTFLLFSCTDDAASPDSDDTSAYSLSDSGGASGGENGNGEIQAGQITAGEWKDTDHWDFWRNLQQQDDYSKMSTYWSYNLESRIDVVVENEASVEMVDISIKLIDKENNILWESKTDNKGKAILWGNLKNNLSRDINELKLQVNNQFITSIKSHSDGLNRIVLGTDVQNKTTKNIDIAFVVDATGSMGDELEYLKVELVDVIRNVNTKEPSTVINMGSVFYRDIEDEYLTRVSSFSADTDKTVDFIKKQNAGGGGDFPEAVHTALQKAINELQWSTKANARLLFLLLDAPPHYEPQVVSEIHQLIAEASQKGIKIIPLTASGIDKETEFLMRYMGVATNGSYIFITNHSGIGNEHLEPTVGDYEVEFLNKLLERVILENI